MKNLVITSSPHIKSDKTVTRIMLDVLIALVPAFIASAVIFGPRAVLICAICVTSCVMFEYVFFKVTKRDNVLADLSAVVTGIILAFNLPVQVPLYVPIIGSFFAIVIVKQLFGGIGQNFANPAITARVVLVITFAGAMTSWTEPFYYMQSQVATAVDAVTTATPLTQLASNSVSSYSFMDMFLGTHGGSLGETCALALILGGIYLVVRKVIVPVIPICFIGTVALFSYILNLDMTVALLGGGLMLGAIFMATDYVTSPATFKGRIIFGIGCGLITVLIRQYGSFPEGVSFAILIMNIITPLLDRYIRSNPLGALSKKEKRRRDKEAVNV